MAIWSEHSFTGLTICYFGTQTASQTWGKTTVGSRHLAPSKTHTHNQQETFPVAPGDGHATSGTGQSCQARNSAPSQRENRGPVIPLAQSLCLTDLQSVAADIKSTLTAAITDLRVDIQSIAEWMGTIEQATTPSDRYRNPLIWTCLSVEIHTHLEDLDNRGCHHNIRIRGIPEATEQQSLEQTAVGIFNDLLERPADSPVEMERLHRALRPRGRENDPPSFAVW